MDITFKYNNKIITTPNLEKKLKRMKLSLEDIEIIETPIKREKSNDGIEDYMLNKEERIIKSTLDDIRRVVYIPKGSNITAEDFFRNWKLITYPDSFYKTLYYE